MSPHIFAGLDGKERAAKPRQQGLTMVIDWGMGPNALEDLLVTGAAHFEFGKVAVGISRLLENDLLQGKIKAYRAHQVEPFPGGMYLEYAEVEGRSELYFPAVLEAGYHWVEVSDNLVDAGVEWKVRMIRQAVEEFDLKVLGEVGKKEGLDKGIPLVEDTLACLEAGSSIVLLEAAELIGDDADTAREVEDVVRAVGVEKIMFELPGPWITGVSAHDIHRMRRQLVARYGSQVNIGNVFPEDLISLEAYRRGLGVNAGREE